MRTFTLFVLALLLSATASFAQTVATFDTLTLPKADTFYTNYSSFGNDVGFDDGLAHFECVQDTFPGGWPYFDHGFTYSNKKDSLTPGYMNDYTSITGTGYNRSSKYVVYYGDSAKVFLKGKAKGQPVNGFYIANTTYAYYSMKDGDMFAKKFGGVSGNDSDWYSVIIRGYINGQATVDSVEVFLADFRSQDNSKDTVYRGWRWVDLLSLGKVDSLSFKISSSDTGAFGINTPKYFCMDDFSTFETSSVKDVAAHYVAKVYPNPAVNELYVELNDPKVRELVVSDVMGRVVSRQSVKDKVTLVPLNTLAAGQYLLTVVGEEQTATVRFVKH